MYERIRVRMLPVDNVEDTHRKYVGILDERAARIRGKLAELAAAGCEFSREAAKLRSVLAGLERARREAKKTP